jgi:hypothetical protein
MTEGTPNIFDRIKKLRNDAMELCVEIEKAEGQPDLHVMQAKKLKDMRICTWIVRDALLNLWEKAAR